MKTLIYDCEIIQCIPNQYEKRNPSLTYCDGWNDYRNMGISVIGTWRNYATFNPFGKYEAFVNETNLTEVGLTHLDPFNKLQKLADQADLIVGFNSLSFDDRLCRANGIDIQTDYDLLIEVRKASGQGDGRYCYGLTKKGYALKDLARANLPYNKSGSGELAPVLWQQGKHQEVISYCLRDIKITKELYFKFINNQLLDPLDGSLLIGNPDLFSYNAFAECIKKAWN
jgi:DEAD/DEAH box helicase domain-containing protein